MLQLHRPQPNEYNPYFARYIGLVPDRDLLDILAKQREETDTLLGSVSESQAEYQYEPGKWSVKEVVGHMADTERVMSYRLLVVARGDTSALPSFDENAYVNEAGFNRQNFEDIQAHFSAVRQSTCSLVASIADNAWLRTGTVFDYPTTARAIAYIIAGHELHHRTIIKERYLSNSAAPKNFSDLVDFTESRSSSK
jgi:hypothetical protein